MMDTKILLLTTLLLGATIFSAAETSGPPNKYESFKGEFTEYQRYVQQEVLRRHNHYRELHGVAHLTEKDELDRYAQAWAEHLAQIEDYAETGNSKYGENIYISDGNETENGSSAVDEWYSEKDQFDFDHGEFNELTSRFTQMVWKSSHDIGTGVAKAKVGTTYIVCFYDPAGNIPGTFRENVLKHAVVGCSQKISV
uniref:SCP domain-containing protein n=1 Tax=Amblyomma maculatum TaxID=34609 RepID=G3MP81_AMBMU